MTDNFNYTKGSEIQIMTSYRGLTVYYIYRTIRHSAAFNILTLNLTGACTD